MSKPFTNNASKPSDVKEAELKERFSRRDELKDFQAILSTKEGRRVIWKYLVACGIFKTSFTGSGSQTFYLEGQRNIGLMLLADVNEASPESYLLMMKESKENP